MPSKQPKKGRLWLNDGSCIRLRPEHRNQVWGYDFVHCRTDDGKAFRTLNILDEFSRNALAIRVKRKLNSTDVIDALTDLFILRGPPAFVRSDNGRSCRPSGSGLDRGCWREDSLHPAGSPWRTAKLRASTPGSGTNCSTGKSSTLGEKHRSSLRAGESTTTQNAPTAPWATPNGPGNHRPDGPTAGHALTNKLTSQIRIATPTSGISGDL